jgi:hypothetical protein
MRRGNSALAGISIIDYTHPPAMVPYISLSSPSDAARMRSRASVPVVTA